MNILTNSQPGGHKSLPAELKLTRNRDGSFGLQRLAMSGAGMQGMGDDPTLAQQITQDIQAASQATLPLLISQTPGVVYTQNPVTGQISVNTVASMGTAGGYQAAPAGYSYVNGVLTPTASVSVGGDLPVLLIGAAVVMVMLMSKR